jgi:hypothetical protein
MILIDTSAWVEFLRDTGTVVCTTVDTLLDEEIATCHPIRMEMLAGARDDKHLSDLRGLLARAILIPTLPGDYEEAAALYRTCRRNGATIRKIIDCLIAAHAIRLSIPVLHSDSDFDLMASHASLAVHLS